MSATPRIVIIGGGVSGALVASHLLRSAAALAISVIERAPRLGRGLAFGRCETLHLLNVPAGRMSALPEDPHHFLRWLEHIPVDSPRRALVPQDLGAESFVPRLLYGEYVEALLEESRRGSRSTFQHIADSAIRIECIGGQYRIALEQGDHALADGLVLALGNVLPTARLPSCAAIMDHPRYSHTLWADTPWRSAARNETVLFIGTGLTMVDGVLAFARAGHVGRMFGLSRRGLLPATHHLGGSLPAFLTPEKEHLDLRSTLAAIRREVRSQRDCGKTWHAVLDSLRSITPTLWTHFSDIDRRRFLRHLKSYWETNRHRLAPELRREIDELVTSGRLSVRAGHLLRIEPHGDRFTAVIRARGSRTTEQLSFDRVVNCTGPEGSLSSASSPLLRSLFEAKLISADSLHLGLRATPSGFVLDANDIASTSILTLGPLLKGMYWETTAVPEIRVQAATVAQSIIDRFTSPAVSHVAQ